MRGTKFVRPASVVALFVGLGAAASDSFADYAITLNTPYLFGGLAVDPGPRGGAVGAGGELPGLSAGQANFFDAGKDAFEELDSVSGNAPAGSSVGLGPTYNSRSCGECHAFPALGGTSPKVNPQVGDATAFGADNEVPFFIRSNGPVREARFKFATKANGRPTDDRDGGVHALYTITGRIDAGNCRLPQPDFVTAFRNDNLSFRIPTPTFGLGLIEQISDQSILASHDSTATLRRLAGIDGHTNTNGNDGTITRFGWKAQNKSLMIFAGEAYNVEQGVTNEIFPNERSASNPACQLNALPEDHTKYEETTATGGSSDVILFSAFMRMLAPPKPAVATASTTRGQALFTQLACNLCHTPSLPLSPSIITAQSNQGRANLYSDLLVHHMGATLADDIVQGDAGPDEFRSAPLWGLGQRLFFLHDGRTSDLVQTILFHASYPTKDFPASEANQSVKRFLDLPKQSQQDLINFLRSL